MKDSGRTLKLDISFLFLLLLWFSGMLYFAFDSAHMAQNSIILCGAAIVMLITYFTSLKLGLVSASAVIFLLAAYTLIQSTVTGEAIRAYVFFWVIWLPLVTLVLRLFLSRSAELRQQNKELLAHLGAVSFIDDQTSLKNLRFFNYDAQRFMHIATAAGIPLHLAVFKLQYESELTGVLGSSGFENLTAFISQTVSKTVGTAGDGYLLGQSPYLWGVLIFGDPSLVDRTISEVNHAIVSEQSHKRSLRNIKYALTLQSGVYHYNGEDLSAFALLQKAKEQLLSDCTAVNKQMPAESQFQGSTD